MKKLLLFLLLLQYVLFSCTYSRICGTYKRQYKVCDGGITTHKNEKLIIKEDSTFTWIRFYYGYSGPIGDSTIEKGTIKRKYKRTYTLNFTDNTSN